MLEPSVREAVGSARAAGIVVLLVTGRMLPHLRRVAGDLHFVDGIVAEDGAVVHFPESGHTRVLAHLSRRNCRSNSSSPLGRTDDGREFSLAVRGRNVLVAGEVKSEKSCPWSCFRRWKEVEGRAQGIGVAPPVAGECHG